MKEGFLIRNGKLCEPVELDRVQLPTKKWAKVLLACFNTCPFDSLAHLLLICALDNNHCEILVKESSNELFNFIELFFNNSSEKEKMKSRAN